MPESSLSPLELEVLKGYGYHAVKTFPAHLQPEIHEGFKELARKATLNETATLFIADHEMPEIGVLAPSKIVLSRKALEVLSSREIIACLGDRMEQALRMQRDNERDKHILGTFASALVAMLSFSAYHKRWQKHRTQDQDPNEQHYAPGRGAADQPAPLEDKIMSRRGAILGTIAGAHTVVAAKQLAPVVAGKSGIPSLVENKAALRSAQDKINDWYTRRPQLVQGR